MDAETVKALMARQLDAARSSAMTATYGWSFEKHDLVVFTTMRPRNRPEHTYLLRTTFDDFPRRAPSYVFIHPQTREITADAWPPNVKHNDSLPGICTPGTREFHEKYHLNDSQYPWDHERYNFIDTLQRIENMMEAGFR